MTPQELEILFKQINQFDRYMGLKLNISPKGEAIYRLTIEPQHTSSPDTAHGAVIAGMMDAQLGITALAAAVAQDMLCSTVELKTNFIQPALLGQTLKGLGEIDFKGKSLVVVSAKITEEKSGQLVARGMGTFNLYPMTKKQILNSGSTNEK